MKDLTISLIQSDLYWEEPEANMASFEEEISLIDHTDLIVLPEMFTSGFSMNAEKLAEPVGGRTFKWMRQMAAHKNAAVTGSYIVKDGGQCYNRLYFVFPDGTSHAYDKKHLFSLAGEGDAYSEGKAKLVVDFLGWKICPLICYDLRFPVWSRSEISAQRLHEYDVVLYVANWPDTRIMAWDALLKARAIENIAYSVGVNRLGRDAFPKDYPGHSAVYSFKGDVMGFSTEEETMTIKLASKPLHEFREKFPFQRDADPFELK
ncbi:MAG: amidohydrolase [Bacteroidota bacterium]